MSKIVTTINIDIVTQLLQNLPEELQQQTCHHMYDYINQLLKNDIYIDGMDSGDVFDNVQPSKTTAKPSLAGALAKYANSNLAE